MTNILLITNKSDITTDFVVKQLTINGASFYRLNTEDILTKVFLSFDFYRNEFHLLDNDSEIIIDLLQIKTVYYRRPLLPKIDNENLTKGEEYFIQSEIINYLEGLYKILKNAFWISSVYSIREAESKIYQLQIAKELGFTIPKSLLTNDKNSALHFTQNIDCIVKPIKTGYIQDEDQERLIFTTLFKEYEQLDRIQFCPTYFQEFINKVADIRVTVIDEKVFAAKIHSQEHEETKIDWRKAEKLKLRYEKVNLTSDLEKLCIKLTKKLGLNFGAIDLVENMKGDYFFLEINPNGQWAWIEKQLDYKISHEIAKLLMNGKN
ncbi:MvdC/MvdD family ATP grasp protein [Myroides odoratimimus]|uniref:MvdC/MvdD family ATP grasp protein n=1 Tax=Myroides odoratimimus TaxID=76832 RepID=UPI0025787060|nr:hypothetical protein [Myroides odoratimimus]MDM1328766.1 hypothetical protein [Myroides odoratimimus]